MRNKIVLSDGVTVLTKIKNFRYTSQVGVNENQFRLGSVCSDVIEFDYYLTGNPVLASGDTFTYYQTVNIDEYLEPIQNDGTRDIQINSFVIASAETGKKTCHVIAYDYSIKLNTDYSQRLKELQGNFPSTLLHLINDVANYCGLTFYYVPSLLPPVLGLPIEPFYIQSITARDIFSWAAELSGYNVKCGGNDIYFTSYPSSNTNWLDPKRYIICPTDQETYTVEESGVQYTEYNVFYKENGFQASQNQQCMYDAVKIIDADGNELSSYVAPGVSTPTTIYYVNGNILATALANGLVSYAAQKIYEKLEQFTGYYPTRVSLFPFRNPYYVGEVTYVVDGRLPYDQQVPRLIPINRITLTESEAVIEAFGVGESADSYSPYSKTNDNSILTIQQQLAESHVQFNTTTDLAIFETVNSNFSGWYSIRGNILTLYMYLYSNSPPLTGATWAVLKPKYRPPYNYMVYPVFNSIAPYTPNGSVWVYANGNVVVYYGSDSPSYACMTFVLKD